MRRVSILAAIAALAALPGAASAINCYTVLDRNDAAIYQDTQPPFDLSESGASSREALRARHEYLTIADADRCPVVAAPPGATGYHPASVDEIVSGIREYAKSDGPVPAAASARGGSRPAATPARSGSPSAATPARSSSARKY